MDAHKREIYWETQAMQVVSRARGVAVGAVGADDDDVFAACRNATANWASLGAKGEE